MAQPCLCVCVCVCVVRGHQKVMVLFSAIGLIVLRNIDISLCVSKKDHNQNHDPTNLWNFVIVTVVVRCFTPRIAFLLLYARSVPPQRPLLLLLLLLELTMAKPKSLVTNKPTSNNTPTLSVRPDLQAAVRSLALTAGWWGQRTLVLGVALAEGQEGREREGAMPRRCLEQCYWKGVTTKSWPRYALRSGSTYAVSFCFLS